MSDNEGIALLVTGAVVTLLIFLLMFAVIGTTIRNVNPSVIEDGLTACEELGQGTVQDFQFNQRLNGDTVMNINCSSGKPIRMFAN